MSQIAFIQTGDPTAMSGNFFEVQIMNNRIIMTKDGLEELKVELEELKAKRPAAVDRLSEARGLGDLSENSEYHAAKDDLSFIDGRIAELEEIIHSAKVVTADQGTSQISVGSKVRLHINGKEEEFTVVGEWEADPGQKKISHESPLGKALLGKKVGEELEVEAPAGKIKYKVVAVN